MITLSIFGVRIPNHHVTYQLTNWLAPRRRGNFLLSSADTEQAATSANADNFTKANLMVQQNDNVVESGQGAFVLIVDRFMSNVQ